MSKPRLWLLTDEPEHDSHLAEAFEALDEAFGTEAFTDDDARRVMKLHEFSDGTFDSLCFGGYVTETSWIE